MKFWVFGLAFLIPSVVDVGLSLIDTFSFIDEFQPSCNLTSDKIKQSNFIVSSKVESTLENVLHILSASTFAWSLAMTVVFSLLFIVGCCSRIKSRTMLKVLLEVSILVSLFGPVTNIKLLLMDCLTGYFTIFLSLFLYSVAVIVTALTTELGFRTFRLSYICPVVTFIFLTLSKAVQIIASTSSFALYFLMSSNHRATTYAFLFFVLVQLGSMWINNIINRSKFYYFFFRKVNPMHHCFSCSVWAHLSKGILCIRVIDITASLLNILSCIVLIALVSLHAERDRNLFFIALFSLCVSVLVSLYQLPWKHCCISQDDEDDYDGEKDSLITGYD